MINILTEKQERKQLKELLEFCKRNHVEMWNYMLTIKNIRKEEREKFKYGNINPYEFERDNNGDLWILIDDGEHITKQKLPDNSPTKFLLHQLKKDKILKQRSEKIK